MDYIPISATSIPQLIFKPEIRYPEIYDSDLKTFQNLNVIDNLTFEGQFKEEIKFSHSKFNSIDFVKSQFCENLFFKDCIFEGDFIIDGAEMVYALFLLDCQFKGNFIIRNIKCSSLIIENTTCSNQMKISGGVFQKLVYSSANEKTIFKIEGRFTLIETLKLTSIIGMTFFSKQCTLNNLLIEGYYNSSSRIDFINIKNYGIELNNINNDGKIYFSNFNKCYVEDIKPIPISQIGGLSMFDESHKLLQYDLKKFSYLDNNVALYNNFFFSTSHKELLYSITAASTFVFDLNPNLKPIFKIHFCSLGILELKDIDMEGMEVQILSSDLSAIKLINTRFPLNIISFNKLNEYYVFNDIYTSAQKQNNYRDKIDYYRLSQEALGNYLKTEQPSKYIPSIVSISVSKLYSNHGSNWIQAILITIFIVGLPLYSLFVWSLPSIHFDFSVVGLKYWSDSLLPYFPQFLNPLHKIDFLEKVDKNMGFWSGWIDIIARVLIGIGLFETVRSFRKFVRV